MMREFFQWVYNWVTVIAGIVAGALSFGVEYLNIILSFTDALGIGTIDLTAIGISTTTAAAITTSVALVKGFVAWWNRP